jgi:hypothetical protein
VLQEQQLLVEALLEQQLLVEALLEQQLLVKGLLEQLKYQFLEFQNLFYCPSFHHDPFCDAFSHDLFLHVIPIQSLNQQQEQLLHPPQLNHTHHLQILK